MTSEAADTLTLVNGTNKQTLNIYSISGPNYERLNITANAYDYLSNPCFAIATQKGGSGTYRNLVLSAPSSEVQVRAGAISLCDGGNLSSNLYYSSGYKNHTANTPGWILKSAGGSNIISLLAAAGVGAGDGAASLIYPWSIDTGSSYFGVWQSTPAYSLDVTGTINATVALKIGGATLLTGTQTGYGTPTNGARQSSFDATSITLPNLAACVAQLIIDLKAGKMPVT